MGANFYFVDENNDEVAHIGKRSAAGPFCWDCGVSLCAAGSHTVHEGNGRWLNACPVCGAEGKSEPLEDSAAGRELGFNKHAPKQKTGVASCSSFNWAMSPAHFGDLADAHNLTIQDEYGTPYSRSAFGAVLSECPIMFWDSIGQEFS